ncbi:MAG TPA: sensor histidine kinase [Candidatus Scybalomonas excrementigallinarum]|nr:sensor histidine kinase [Candidatus Scybalomonas excrementigallinarum]
MFLTILWILCYLVFLKCIIKTSLTKLLFVLLNMLNYRSFTTILYTYFSSFYEGKEVRPYSMVISGIYLLILFLSYPFVFSIMIKKVRPVIEFSENKSFFRYLWCIPATFCLSYYYNLYNNGGISGFSSELKNVLFAVFFNMGAFFITWIIVDFIAQNHRNLHVRMENHYLHLQSIQYESLKNKMEESRRAKHDMKQVLRVAQSYLYNKEYERLKGYLDEYLKTSPSEEIIFYCSNYALNALIVYYKDLANKYKIPFEISIQIEEIEGIGDTELVVLYGNLLDNAMEACIDEKNKNPYIHFSMIQVGNGIYTVIENSYYGVIKRKEKRFETTKQGHTGIGLYSVEQIVKKYEGMLEVKVEEEKFWVSFLFYPMNEKEDRKL